MPKSNNSSTLNTLGTLGALGVLGAGGYAGYRHYKKKQQEERKKAAIRNAILGTVGGTAAAGGAAYGGLKYLQHRNAKDLENLKNLEFLTNVDNNIDKLDRLAKQHLPLGVDPIVPNTEINTSGLHPKTPTPAPTFNVMGAKVTPTKATTGTVSFAGNKGKVPNPAGSTQIQLSPNRKIRTQQLDDLIATLDAKVQPQGRQYYPELGGAHSEENRQVRRRKKQQRAKSLEVQARREARKAKELAHQQRMAEQSRLHKLESKRMVGGNKVIKNLIAAGIPPREAVDIVVNAKKPGGSVALVQEAANRLLETNNPNKAKVRIPGRSGAKLRGRARVNALKAGKKVLSALT